MILYDYYIENVLKPNIKEFNDFYNGNIQFFKGKKYRNPYKSEYYHIVKQIEEQVDSGCTVFNFCVNVEKGYLEHYYKLLEKDVVANRINNFIKLLFGYNTDKRYMDINNKLIYNGKQEMKADEFIDEVSKLINYNNKDLFVIHNSKENMRRTKWILENNFMFYCLYTRNYEDIKYNFVLDTICYKYYYQSSTKTISSLIYNFSVFEYVVNRYSFIINKHKEDKYYNLY